MPSILVFLLISSASALNFNNNQIPLHAGSSGEKSLREWLQKDECFNLALAPQFNNQHSLFGILQYFKDEGLLEHMSGIAACSGGTLPAAFFGAGKDFESFQKTFPKEGWMGFGPSEPKITEDFHNFVRKAELPEDLKDMKIPVAVSLSMWDSDKAMTEPNPNVTSLIVNRGSTRDTLTAALATGSEGGIPDEKCPKCLTGFWPKKLGNASTITDGAFSDLMGVQGLIGLPKCNRVLHILPLDYPGQIGALPRDQMPGKPKDIVTLFFTQPPVASHGYFMEQVCDKTIPFTDIPVFCNSFFNWLSGGNMISYRPSQRSGGQWNDLMFELVHKATGSTIDKKFDGESEPGHKLMTLETHKLFQAITTKNENEYNLMAEQKRDRYWSNFLASLVKAEELEKAKSDVSTAVNAASSGVSKTGYSALSAVKKIETTYEMPQISLKTSLNYPAA